MGKFIILLIFTSVNSFALDCDYLEQELINTQIQLEGTPREACSLEPDKQKPFCYSSGDGDNISLPTAQREYEAKLAAVAIREGLSGIAMGIEDNHHALKTIKKSEIETAKKKMNEFMRVFKKGQAVQHALTMKEDGSYLLKDFNTELDADYLTQYIPNKCEDTKNDSLCGFYNSQNEEDKKSINESLHGFFKAYNKTASGQSDMNIRKEFQDYRNYLNVQHSDSKGTSLGEYSKSTEFGKIEKYQSLLKTYEKGGASEATKQQILSLANDLYEVKLNYGSQLGSKTSEERNFLDGQLNNAMTSLESSAATGLTFKKTEENLSRLEDVFRNKLAELNLSIKNDTGSGNIVSNIAKQQEKLSDQIAIIKSLKACFPNRSDKDLSLSEYQQESQKKNTLQSCYKKLLDSDFYSKFGISSDLETARKELDKSHKKLKEVEGGTPIKQLQHKKLALIRAIGSRECGVENSTIDDIQSVCNTPKVDDFSQSIINVSEILLTYSLDGMSKVSKLEAQDKFKSKAARDANLKGRLQYYNNALSDCPKSQPVGETMSPYCIYVHRKISGTTERMNSSFSRQGYEAITLKEATKARKKLVRKNIRMQVERQAELDGGPGYVSAGAGIAAGLGRMLPYGIQSIMYVDQYKQQSMYTLNSALNSYKQQRYNNSWYMGQQNYFMSTYGVPYNPNSFYTFDYQPTNNLYNPSVNNFTPYNFNFTP